MSKVIQSRGYVYAIQYYIVWCVKYRHKVISGNIEDKLKELINKIAEDNEFTIEEMETD